MIPNQTGLDGPARCRSRGQALVELALALPILLLVMFGVVEAGVFAFTSMTVQNAAQDGGRLAALPDTADEATVKSYVLDRAAIAPVTLDATDITITIGCATSPCTYAGRTTGDSVRLVVNYSYSPLIAMVFGNGASFTLTAETEYHVE